MSSSVVLSSPLLLHCSFIHSSCPVTQPLWMLITMHDVDHEPPSTADRLHCQTAEHSNGAVGGLKCLPRRLCPGLCTQGLCYVSHGRAEQSQRGITVPIQTIDHVAHAWDHRRIGLR